MNDPHYYFQLRRNLFMRPPTGIDALFSLPPRPPAPPVRHPLGIAPIDLNRHPKDKPSWKPDTSDHDGLEPSDA